MDNNDKILQNQTQITMTTKLLSKYQHQKCRHKISIMNVKSDKKEGQKCKTKEGKAIDMEDTMNYLQKHSHCKSLQKAESLLQKQNPYKIKFTNVSSTRQPKTTYVES